KNANIHDGGAFADALQSAVAYARQRGDMSGKGLASAIDAELKMLVAADKDGSGDLDATELGRVKAKGAQGLAAFAKKHAGDSASDFDVGSPAKPKLPTGTFH